jgi:hypothetical protein
MPRLTMCRTLLAAVAAALMAGACATPTPYQPIGARGTGASGGFSDVRVAADRYRVTFAGNSMTSRERVETYLLYRAAELTRERGYDGFTIVDRATDRDVETRVYQDPFGPGRYRWWRPSWRYRGAGWGWRRWDPWFGDPFWADDIDVRTVQRFEANAEIVMFRGNRADDKSFNAREVLTNLGPNIELPRER